MYYGANGQLLAADAQTLAFKRSVAFPSTAGVQASALLTTAYQAQDNCVYLYVTQNTQPGNLYVIADNGDTLELSVLDTPSQGNYSIVSPICDASGTIYYRNDAGYLIAVESTQRTGCTVAFSTTPSDAQVLGEGQSSLADKTYGLTAGT